MKSTQILIVALLLTLSTSVVLPEPSSTASCCSDNSIVVTGAGKVSVEPDIAIVNVGVSVTALTSQQASHNVAQKINQVTQILKSNNINAEDIKTQSLSIYPQYQYPDGKVQLVGQQAQQTLAVTVRKIDSKGGNLGQIIDQLVGVDGIQFNGLTFDKEDKTEAQKQARKLAFENAKNKATEFAGFAERGLGKVLTIVDDSADAGIAYPTSNALFAKSEASTQVPVGKIEVQNTVNVKFSLR